MESVGALSSTHLEGIEKRRCLDAKGEECGVAATSQSPEPCCPSYLKRSKSASERNAELQGDKTVDFAPNVSDESTSTGVSNGKYKHQRSPMRYPSAEVTSHRLTSLENDIKQLQTRLLQEKSTRVMLERALGRASSTLSPGHRHLTSQAKELISEIETLEEEVADREQHVLSMYRNIFDQCVSRASSTQCSETSSPSHTKNGGRKHPLVISGAFCSSRKFSLYPFNQVLGSIKESGKKTIPSHTNHGFLLNGCTKAYVETNIPMKVQKRSSSPMLKSYLASTPKNHLHRFPNRLSEELVRCMAHIYCWTSEKSSANQDKIHSPALSRSSTSSLHSRNESSDNSVSKSTMVEISWIPTNKNHFSRTSLVINNYRVLVEQLEKVDVSSMENKAQLAFWINIYNSLIMHAFIAYGIPHSSLRRMSLFHKAAYSIGGHVISAGSIEYFILGCHTPRASRWFDSILWNAMRKKSGDDKQILSSGFRLTVSQPIVLFALCSGASSDPMLKVYTAKHIEDELEKAKKDFLQANVIVKKSRRVFLPKLLERYSKEAAIALDDLLVWVCGNVDSKLQESIKKCVDDNVKKKASQIIEWLPYNTKFRYVFGKDLLRKNVQ